MILKFESPPIRCKKKKLNFNENKCPYSALGGFVPVLEFRLIIKHDYNMINFRTQDQFMHNHHFDHIIEINESK